MPGTVQLSELDPQGSNRSAYLLVGVDTYRDRGT